MSFRYGKPSNFFSPIIKQYWAIENHSYHGEIHTQRIIPSGLPELTFYFSNIPECSDSNKTILSRSLISGQQKMFYDLRLSGSMDLFSIIFQPHGLTPILNIPTSEFYNKIVPLKFIIKTEGDQLEALLSEEPKFEDKIQVAESYLFKLLARNKASHHTNRIKHCIDLINLQKGNIGIETLASEACFSRKQFERKFSAQIGSTPKQFLKTIRFQNALHKKSQLEIKSLTELAYACGYFDQSHMTNDFKNLTGMNPSEFFSKCKPYSDYFE